MELKKKEIIYIMLLMLSLCGWMLHFIFILVAFNNDGIIIINYNYFNEMFLEIILISSILILLFYILIIELREK